MVKKKTAPKKAVAKKAAKKCAEGIIKSGKKKGQLKAGYKYLKGGIIVKVEAKKKK